MNSFPPAAEGIDALESVIATAELDRRPARVPDSNRENQALVALTHQLAKSPDDFFAKLVTTALELSGAHSTGISLLDETAGRFIWPAVAGQLRSYIGGGTPREFGPCGTVLDRQAVVLFHHPERHFAYLTPIAPPLEEVLLIPFYMDGKAVGTIWAVLHTTDRKFDSEDRRLLENLSAFAASAYRVFTTNGTLTSLLRPKQGHATAAKEATPSCTAAGSVG